MDGPSSSRCGRRRPPGRARAVVVAVVVAVLRFAIGGAAGAEAGTTAASPDDAGAGRSSGRAPERVILDDRDWSGPATVASATNVATNLTPAVLLQTEVARPVPLFDPTDDETITCMAAFKGRLYVGSCTRPADTDTGSIFTYDVDTHTWKKVFQVQEQGLIRLEVHGDTLCVPGYDANDGGWELGNIYLHDGTNWVERRTVPRAVHIYGLTVHEGRIYLSADVFDEGLRGDNSGSRVQRYGRVMSSGDAGLTWREEHRGPTPG